MAVFVMFRFRRKHSKALIVLLRVHIQVSDPRGTFGFVEPTTVEHFTNLVDPVGNARYLQCDGI